MLALKKFFENYGDTNLIEQNTILNNYDTIV